MPAALLPPRGWEEIKQASIAGVTYKELSLQYGVSEESIRKQASRGKWPTPQAVEKERIKRAQSGGVSNLSAASLSRQSRNEEKGVAGEGGSVVVVAETLQDLAETGSLHFQRLAVDAITRKKRLVIHSTSDACNLVKTVRSVAGLDKAAQVQINVGSWGAASSQVEVNDLGD